MWNYMQSEEEIVLDLRYNEIFAVYSDHQYPFLLLVFSFLDKDVCQRLCSDRVLAAILRSYSLPTIKFIQLLRLFSFPAAPQSSR